METTLREMAMTVNGAILAAGMATRLRPALDPLGLPKCMVEVGGRPILDYVLQEMVEGGINLAAINLHFRREKITQYLNSYQNMRIIRFEEDPLLDTGGGLQNLSNLLGEGLIAAVNCDVICLNGPSGNLWQHMRSQWNDLLDMLLLLQPLNNMTVTDGSGDYNLDANGRPSLASNKSGTHFWTGRRLLHPRIFNGMPDNTPYSFLDLMKKTEAQGRLGAVVYDGICYHISRLQDLQAANDDLQKKTLILPGQLPTPNIT
jgi:MurNAc alpha-1-phosphate uridylyltransferase